MTIGEVAKRTGLSISSIRYYERKGILKEPNRISKNRIYTESDLSCLNYLKSLKQIGMPLSEIKEYFDIKKLDGNHEVELEDILIGHKLYLEMKIEEYQEVLSDIDNRLANINENCEGE